MLLMMLFHRLTFLLSPRTTRVCTVYTHLTSLRFLFNVTVSELDNWKQIPSSSSSVNRCDCLLSSIFFFFTFYNYVLIYSYQTATQCGYCLYTDATTPSHVFVTERSASVASSRTVIGPRPTPIKSQPEGRCVQLSPRFQRRYLIFCSCFSLHLFLRLCISFQP